MISLLRIGAAVAAATVISGTGWWAYSTIKEAGRAECRGARRGNRQATGCLGQARGRAARPGDRDRESRAAAHGAGKGFGR